MTDNEMTREKTFSEELSYFQERIKEVFDNYYNLDGSEDPLYINVLRDSRRIVRKAEEEITRQQAEIERLKEKCENTQIGYNFAQDDVKRLKKEIQITKDAYTMLQTTNEIIKLEAVKEFAARLKENISDDCHIVSDEGEYVGYDCGDVMHCIDNLVKEMVG